MEMYSYIFPSGCVSVAHYALALRWLTDFNTAGYAAVVAVQALLLMLVAAVSSNEAAFRSRWSGWWLLTPAALVLLEAVQHRFPFGGFPLSAFGYSQTDGPFMAAAPLGGALLVTALAAVAGGRCYRCHLRAETSPCSIRGRSGRGTRGTGVRVNDRR